MVHKVQLDPAGLPTVKDKPCNEWVEKKVIDGYEGCRSFCLQHSKWIILCVFLSIITIIVCIILFTSTTKIFPCMRYSANDLASTVSVECIQYLWNMNCATKSPYTFPLDYQGWLRKSPQGGTIVRCIQTPCGVGSYSNLLVYTALCTLQS